jgi:hypothetical protein
MTEAEWLASADPGQMLWFLRDREKVSQRKLRLFGAACCRRIWHAMPDERSRRAVEIAEAFADGLVTAAEAEAAGNIAAEVTEEVPDVDTELGWRAARAADHLLPVPAESWMQPLVVWEYAGMVLEGEQLIREGAAPEMLEAWSEQVVESGKPMGLTDTDPGGILADLLREIIGPVPFGRGTIPTSLLRWNDGTVSKIAQAIYEERAFERLPILADALEDAGCDDADILAHCRSAGPHVRGCWVIDLLLGKG